MATTSSLAHRNSEFWALVAKYRRSKRGEMLEAILETARNSTELAEKLGIESSTAGNYLREAKRDGLVECVTPDADRYKMYVATEKGQEIAEEI